MYKQCKTQQSSVRQRELELGLLRQLQRRRFDEVSVSDLCLELNIPRKSFYRYFASKEGALFSLLDHAIMEFYEEGNFEGLYGGTPQGDLERFFRFWYQKKDLLDALHRSNLSGVLVERCTLLASREQLVPSLVQGEEKIRQEAAIAFAVCGLLAIVFRWRSDGFRTSAREMAEIAVSMLSRPLLPRQEEETNVQ